MVGGVLALDMAGRDDGHIDVVGVVAGEVGLGDDEGEVGAKEGGDEAPGAAGAGGLAEEVEGGGLNLVVEVEVGRAAGAGLEDAAAGVLAASGVVLVGVRPLAAGDGAGAAGVPSEL